MTISQIFDVLLTLLYLGLAGILLWTFGKFLTDAIVIVRQYRSVRTDIEKMRAH